MDKQLWSALKQTISQRYGKDIDAAVFHYSTQNYAFIFPNEPFMIRVSMSPKKQRKEILSELLWVDDLKLFKETICEPGVSLRGNLIEEFVIDDVVYRASMFRTARGKVVPVEEMDALFFILLGDLMGSVHKASAQEGKAGIRYQRSAASDMFAQYKERTFPGMPADIRKKIEEIEAQVNALPRDCSTYGLCHGGFHGLNFFRDGNNLWLFDFDSCVYANYMYDVACFIQDALMRGFGAGQDCRRVLEANILPYLKLGYDLAKPDGTNDWAHLELMIAYRAALALMATSEIKVSGMADLEAVQKYFHHIIRQDDIVAAMTQR